MTRNEARKAAEVMLAYADGKEIEYKCDSGWIETLFPDFNFKGDYQKYRIKFQPIYRSFKNAEECWEEILKHQPTGWVKSKKDGHRVLITLISSRGLLINRNEGWSLEGMFNNYTFADGTPFGKKDENQH